MRSFAKLPAHVRFLFSLAAMAALAGCAGADSEFEAYDNTEEVRAYYEEHPDFFRFASLDDLPTDLDWEDGSDLPELGSPEARRGGTWNARMQDFPRTLRIVGPDANSGIRPFLLDDVLISIAHLHPNVEGEHRYFPGLAEEWAVDWDAQTVYVRLDPEARWSDGNPVTTDDYFFTFYFYQSEYIQDPWYNNWFGFDINYTNITRYDDRTFSIAVKDRRPNMPALVFDFQATPREYYRDFGPDFVERYQWRFQPTTGRYEITDEELDRIQTDRTGIRLTAVDDWWAADKRNWRYRYNPDELSLRVIRDTPNAFQSALAAELDFVGPMGLAEYWYDQFPNDHELVRRGLVHKTTFYNDVPRPTYGLWINSAMPLLDNQDIRTGIQYASNWQLVLDQYFRGDYVRMNTPHDGYGDMTNPNVQARPFDLGLAAEHFARAGFTRRGPDGILVNEEGQRLSFNLSTGYESLAPVMNILRQEALKAGLELRVEILDGSTGFAKAQEKNHEISFTAFGTFVEAYPRYWEHYHSVNAYDEPYLADGVTPNPARQTVPQTNNLESIAVPELDALIDAYDVSESLDEMREMAYRMEEIIDDHASFVPGFVLPFYRTAYWRWVRWPDDFNVRFSQDAVQYFLFWIDEEMREETLAARRGTESFPARIEVYDQWRVD